jgi:hypothetical protein
MKPFFSLLALERFALPLNGNLSSKIKVHFGLYNIMHTKLNMEGIFGFLGGLKRNFLMAKTQITFFQ